MPRGHGDSSRRAEDAQRGLSRLGAGIALRARAKSISSLLVETGRRWADDRCYGMGASLAFYAIFSVFPLLLLLTTLFGYLLGSRGSISDTLINYIASSGSPGVRALLDETLASMQQHQTARGVGAITGIFTLFFGASGVFSELDYSLNFIWRVPPSPAVGIWASIVGTVRGKAIALALVAAAELVALVSVILGTGLSSFADSAQSCIRDPGFWQVVETVISTVFLAVVVAAIFRTLPRAYVAWRDVAAGAALTAVLFAILKRLLAWYLAHVVSYAIYGAVGAVLGLLMWIYLVSQIFFFGAEFSRVYAEHYGSRAASRAAGGPRKP